MKKILSCIIVMSMLLTVSCPVLGKEKSRFEFWTEKIFENDSQYDVVDRNSFSVKNQCYNDNISNYINEEYDKISNYCIENGYAYTRNMEDDGFSNAGNKPNASKSKYVHRDYQEQFTQNNKTITAETILESTLRINDATGVITSYSGPYLSLTYDNAGYAFTTNLIDASTEAVLSSTKRTITISCSYRVQSVGAFQEGGVVLTYISPVFNHSFVEG